MKTGNEMRTLLLSLDRKSYPAYKSLNGRWQFGDYILSVDHVQGDPFASPSDLSVEISHEAAGFPEIYYQKDCARIALQDFLTRKFEHEIDRCSFLAKGSGKSGLLTVSRCGQRVLERSACQIGKKGITVRFRVGFPAFGRTIAAQELEKILFDYLPKCLDRSFYYKRLRSDEVKQAVDLAEDQEALRKIIKEEHLASFVANGAILPRKSGISELPMEGAVPFVSPPSLERTFSLPHKGKISGMGIPEGITLIIGGGYHGKTTLLEAVQDGVYDHISGDGREYVVTEETAVKLRAENGRSIRNVDISLFIKGLPNKKDTTRFSTPNASGSTSQAAGAVEGMEAGSRLFLIDEDTSATNFLLRDDFMQEVIRRDQEPITPFLERARDLYDKAGISTILVAGVSGAFFYIADLILQIDCYVPVDITGKVKEMCKDHKAPRTHAPDFAVPAFGARTAMPVRNPSGAGAGQQRRGRGRNGEQPEGDGRNFTKIKTFGRDSFSVGRETVDVRYVEQIADTEQVNGLAHLLRYLMEHPMEGKRSMKEMVRLLSNMLEKKGWEPFCGSYVPCGLAMPREQEIFACLNRLR